MSLYSAVKRALKEILSKLIDTLTSNIDTPLSSLLRVRVYEQDFEDGTSDLSTTNCTQAVQSTEVYAGNYALDVTVSAGNTGHIDTPMRPVSPNQRVTFTFAHKEDANITSVKLIVVWYRENLHEIGTEEYDLTPSTSWQLDNRTVTAPTNAAYMGLRMEATAGASDGHVYLDSMTMDLVGQIFRVDGQGQVKVADTDLLNAFNLISNTGLRSSLKVSSGQFFQVPEGKQAIFYDNVEAEGLVYVEGELEVI